MYSWENNRAVDNEMYKVVLELTYHSRMTPDQMQQQGDVTELFDNDYAFYEEFMTYLFYKYSKIPASRSVWFINMVYDMSGLNLETEIRNNYCKNIAYNIWHNYRLSGPRHKTSLEMYRLIVILCREIFDTYGLNNSLF